MSVCLFQIQKGKLHGSIDVGLSVMSIKKRARRIDLDTEEHIYHLKVCDLLDLYVHSLKYCGEKQCFFTSRYFYVFGVYFYSFLIFYLFFIFIFCYVQVLWKYSHIIFFMFRCCLMLNCFKLLFPTPVYTPYTIIVKQKKILFFLHLCKCIKTKMIPLHMYSYPYSGLLKFSSGAFIIFICYYTSSSVGEVTLKLQ